MLPHKWKIFRIVTLLHLAAAFSLLSHAIFNMTFSTYTGIDNLEDAAGYFSLTLGQIAFLANDSINLYLLERCYPDQLPGKVIRRISPVLFVIVLFTAIVVLLYSVVTGYQFLDNVSPGLLYSFSRTVQLFMAILLVTGLTGLYILWNQVSLRKALQRNHKLSMENFLENAQTQP